MPNYTGIRVLDISTPTQPREVSHFGGSSVQTLSIVGRYAALALPDRVAIYDLADPVHPALVGEYVFNTLAGAADLTFDGRYVYVTDWSMKLYVFDAANLASINKVSEVQLGGSGTSLLLVDKLLYLGLGGGLEVLDVSDPAHPRDVASYGPIGGANQVAVAGRLVYVADGSYGLWVLRLIVGDEQHLPLVAR